jgi:hypothetical protein
MGAGRGSFTSTSTFTFTFTFTWLVIGVLLAGCPGGDDGPPPPSKLDAGGAVAAPEKAASALLESSKGKVTIERAGKKDAAKLGYLYVGDAIETGEDGEAVVRFPGGRVVELGPEGRFEIKEGEGGLVLSVAQGLVLTRNATDAPAQPLPGGNVQLTILTPFGFTKVGGGEELNLTLTVNDKGASVDVKLGSVDLVATDGTVTKIGAGQKGGVGANAPKEMNLEPVVVNLSAAGGKAEVKGKDDAKWVAVNAKKPAPIAQGDSFRVKSGRATMQAPGGQAVYSFAAGSEAVMDKASKGATAEETGFDLKKGELNASSPVKTRLNLGGGVSLTADAASQYSLRRTKDGYEIDSVTGDIKVERDGAEPATIPGGRTASVPVKGSVKSQEVAREAVQLPPKPGMKIFHAGIGRFAITWDGEPDKPYRVEVANDPAYKQKVASGVVHSRFINVNAPNFGSLYWHVFDGDKEIAKGSASFATEAADAERPRNNNLVREGSDRAQIYFQDKPPKVIFQWDEDPDAQKYKVAVYRDGQLSKPLLEKTQAGVQFPTDEGALGEGKYLWSVTPLDAKGGEIRGGRMNKLEITYDNAVRNLKITSPKNGDAGGAKVRCAGIAPVGAKVSVNGKPVPLDEKSRFDIEVPPVGNGLMVFRMVNGPAEVYTVRKVKKGK